MLRKEGEPTADVQMTIPDAVADAKPDPEPTGKPTVSYSGHVQTYGDRAEVKDGATLGTTGEGKRLEALKVTVSGGSITYRAHVQGTGWQEWRKDGAEAGTHAQAKRMEAVQMQLDDTLSKDYSVWYRVHSQTFGWLGWACDGEPAGTTGLAKRVEAIEIVVLPKGETPKKEYDAKKASYVGGTTCDAHVQTTGWTGNQMGLSFGTTGKAKRLEAIKLTLAGEPYGGGIEYDVHCQTTGWQATKADGELAGTTGKAKRLEAVRVRLTGDEAKRHLSVWYRVHSQTFGWLGWASDGDPAGTTGLAKRAEAIEVQVPSQGCRSVWLRRQRRRLQDQVAQSPIIVSEDGPPPNCAVHSWVGVFCGVADPPRPWGTLPP